ncbi:hypothetical protein ADL22_21985 [Streptomyces sp. NRRL F-4489]|uniref:hypothetical protein n=1 Tax=Streptomyces sp. NRRL F-4489 TaxID=1609095 RepID=UPI00074A014D|nr:hypothetical protein [Streptomyces sp. NRRL F-4489]KUL37341.1 hypothetical protein ADL22_21985 [Streptomyces sp. NRRL F-4489]
MTHTLTADRFDYHVNLGNAGTYRTHRGAFWPPAGHYRVSCLDLAGATPDLGDGFRRGLAALTSAIEAEWQRVKDHGVPARRRFNEPRPTAEALRALAAHLPGDADRRALELRANAVEHGYDDAILKELAALKEEFTVVAGQLSTWYGKEVKGLPTAFACRADRAGQDLVDRALDRAGDVTAYLRGLHPALRLGDLPAFGAARLFFMAGEGNLHPKHIAYFLPEDEGVKHSPFKKTYYFRNTHRALLDTVSAPLAAAYLAGDRAFDPADPRFAAIPLLGVLSHELGHFVHRPGNDFKELNAADRWASVVLQETAADVFGILTLADVWAEPLGLDPADVIAYYLAECLRYTDRGLGHFPDSDGMFLQLSYFVQLGALGLDSGPAGPRLTADSQTVLAGLRSLARVLADSLLAGTAAPATALHQAFGPATPEPLAPLIDALRTTPFASVEYTQEHLHRPAAL